MSLGMNITRRLCEEDHSSGHPLEGGQWSPALRRGQGRQSKAGYPLFPKGIIKEGTMHAQGEGFHLPLALSDVVIFTVIFFNKTFTKENSIEVPKNILVYKCNAQKTLCSSFICFCFRSDAHPVFGMWVGEIADWTAVGFPVSWGVGCARLAAWDTGDRGPTGTSELCSALSPENFLSDALTGQFLPFADTDLERKRKPVSSEQRESIGCPGQC